MDSALLYSYIFSSTCGNSLFDVVSEYRQQKSAGSQLYPKSETIYSSLRHVFWAIIGSCFNL